MRKGAFAITNSARVVTTKSNGSSSNCCSRLEAAASAVDLATVDARGLEVPAAWSDLKSPENYVGYGRTENFASSGGALRDRPRVYAVPGRLRLNHWALSGRLDD